LSQYKLAGGSVMNEKSTVIDHSLMSCNDDDDDDDDDDDGLDVIIPTDEDEAAEAGENGDYSNDIEGSDGKRDDIKYDDNKDSDDEPRVETEVM